MCRSWLRVQGNAANPAQKYIHLNFLDNFSAGYLPAAFPITC
jgi:hypothetical protein